MKRTLKDMLIESAMIIVSILIAFGLSEWGEQRRQTGLANTALDHVKRELNENYVLLMEDLLPRHKEILETVTANLEQIENGQQATGELHHALGRPIYQRILRRSAWDLLLESGLLLNIEYDTSASTASIYDMQEMGVISGMRDVLTVVSSRESLEDTVGVTTRKLLKSLMSELVARDRYLINNYQQLYEKEQWVLPSVQSK